MFTSKKRSIFGRYTQRVFDDENCFIIVIIIIIDTLICLELPTLRVQSFTSLMVDLHQNINKGYIYFWY